MKTTKQKILCIGSMGKDIFFPVSSDVIVDGKKKEKKFCFGYGSKVHVEDRFIALGGCACNISIGLSRLGIDTTVLGNVADDSDGEWITNTLEKEGVDISKIRVVKNANTDMSVIIVDSSAGERTIFVNRDVGEKLIIDEKDTAGFDWCFIGSLYGEHIKDNMRIVHDAIIHNGLKLAYNPGGSNITKNIDIVLDLIHHTQVLFVNKSEANEIVSKFDLKYNDDELTDELILSSVLHEHMSADDGIVVLTDGRRGAWVYDGSSTYHINTIDKSVHDATGAGDAFASGFIAGVFYNKSLEDCMRWGGVNSDMVIDHYGAQEGLQMRDAIEKRGDLFIVESKTRL